MAAAHQLVVFVPVTHAEAVRSALAQSGAGKLGNYDSCSFSVRGMGRFRPLKGSKPAVGTQDVLKEVEEERIEVHVAARADLPAILRAVKAAHPYEEPAIHVLPILDGSAPI